MPWQTARPRHRQATDWTWVAITAILTTGVVIMCGLTGWFLREVLPW